MCIRDSIATESQGRNVLIKGQYAVQELRAIPVQQSGNGLYDRPGGCVQRGTAVSYTHLELHKINSRT